MKMKRRFVLALVLVLVLVFGSVPLASGATDDPAPVEVDTEAGIEAISADISDDDTKLQEEAEQAAKEDLKDNPDAVKDAEKLEKETRTKDTDDSKKKDVDKTAKSKKKDMDWLWWLLPLLALAGLLAWWLLRKKPVLVEEVVVTEEEVVEDDNPNHDEPKAQEQSNDDEPGEKIVLNNAGKTDDAGDESSGDSFVDFGDDFGSIGSK